LSTSPHFFRPHPNLSDEVNRNFVQSEIEGGVFLNDLPPATVLEVQTRHHCYQVVLLDDNEALISGHPRYCPEPTRVAIAGSTWGGSMLKRRFVGRGMHLEFCHPAYQTPIVTSTVQEIREPQLAGPPLFSEAWDMWFRRLVPSPNRFRSVLTGWIPRAHHCGRRIVANRMAAVL
jgi:hypothetical protein